MNAPQSNSSSSWIEAPMLRPYGSKSDSDTPLDVPRRLVTRSCIVAIILGVVLSNLVLNGLWKLAEANLKSQELNLGAYVDFEDPADPRVLRAKKLLPPELHNKVKPEQLINDPDVDSLLRDDVITYADAETFLSAVAGWDRDNSPASVLLIGNLRYDYLGIAPLFDPEPPSEVLGRSEYDRPNFRSISVLEGRDLKYALGGNYLAKGFWADISETPRTYETGNGRPITCDLTDLGADFAVPVSRTEFEQAINADLGVFLRAMKADGRTKTLAFTETDNSISAGAVLQGTAWGRGRDSVGVGVLRNGLSAARRNYLEAGGISFFLGDGSLRYRNEQVAEAFYSAHVWRDAFVTLDVQRMWNPGYNADRGPANFAALRLHAEF